MPNEQTHRPAVQARMIEPVVRQVLIRICQPCLDGEGSECHTPGCALFLHKVDLPIIPELYHIVPDDFAQAHCDY